MKRFAVPTAALAAIAAAAVLSACTAAGPTAGTTAPAPPTPSPTKTAAPGTGDATAGPIEAVLTVAGVDPDGQHVTASGYVQGIVEDGGACVFAFAGAGTAFTVQQAASADRMTASCGTVQVPIEKFQRGPWQVTVAMTIEGETHTSQPITVEVP